MLFAVCNVIRHFCCNQIRLGVSRVDVENSIPSLLAAAYPARLFRAPNCSASLPRFGPVTVPSAPLLPLLPGSQLRKVPSNEKKSMRLVYHRATSWSSVRRATLRRATQLKPNQTEPNRVKPNRTEPPAIQLSLLAPVSQRSAFLNAIIIRTLVTNRPPRLSVLRQPIRYATVHRVSSSAFILDTDSSRHSALYVDDISS